MTELESALAPRAITPGGFRREVKSWSRRIGVQPREIRLRSMKRKLASATSTGRITFDVSLLHEAPERRTEVIIHELVHLKVGNHGRLFRSLVRAHLAGSVSH
jgi:predicted metal-dependent hydrolase